MLAGQGPPRPEPGKPVVVKPAQRRALVLPYNPVRSKPVTSPQVKHFLEHRNDRAPASIQVFVVLRGANG
jgi:hypothetical protein